LLCRSAERHREQATSNAADERAPIITQSLADSSKCGHTTPAGGFARVGEDQQLTDKNRSMAAIEPNALWPQVAGSGQCSMWLFEHRGHQTHGPRCAGGRFKSSCGGRISQSASGPALVRRVRAR